MNKLITNPILLIILIIIIPISTASLFRGTPDIILLPSRIGNQDLNITPFNLYVNNIFADGNLTILGSVINVTTFNINVTGNIIASGTITGNNSQWNRSGTNVILANTNDDVGIGTITPAQKLEVVGVAQTDFLIIDGIDDTHISLNGRTSTRWDIDANAAGDLDFYSATGAIKVLAFQMLDNHDFYLADDDQAILYGDNKDVKTDFDSAGAGNYWIDLTATANVGMNVETTGNTNSLYIDGSTGNVGVGTNDPQGKLEINPSTGLADIRITSEDGTAQLRLDSETSGVNLDFRAAGTGTPTFTPRKSRGTLTNPTATLDNDFLFSWNSRSYGDTDYQVPFSMEIQASQNHTDSAMGIDFMIKTTEDDSTVKKEMLSFDGALKEIIINNEAQDWNFRVEGVGASNALVVQGSDGNVGIGTGTPEKTLTVNGTVLIEYFNEDETIFNITKTKNTGSTEPPIVYFEWNEDGGNIGGGQDGSTVVRAVITADGLQSDAFDVSIYDAVFNGLLAETDTYAYRYADTIEGWESGIRLDGSLYLSDNNSQNSPRVWQCDQFKCGDFFYDGSNERWNWNGGGFGLDAGATIFFDGSAAGVFTRFADLRGMYLSGLERITLITPDEVWIGQVGGLTPETGYAVNLNLQDKAKIGYNGQDMAYNLFSTGKNLMTGDLIIGDQTSLGDDLVTCGDFSCSTSWVLGADWIIANGVLNKTTNTGINTAYQTITGLTIGRLYYINYTTTFMKSPNHEFTITFAGLDHESKSGLLFPDPKSFLVRATSTSHNITFTPETDSTSSRFTIDDVSVTEVGWGDLDVGNTEVNGDLNVTGNATINNFYGEMFLHNHPAVATDLITQDVYENVTGWTINELNGFHNNTNYSLITEVAGLYRVDYAISSAGTFATNDEYSYAVHVNNIEQEQTHAHRNSGTSMQIGSVGGTGFIRLNVGDEVHFMIKDESAPVRDLDISSANMNLVRIGT